MSLLNSMILNFGNSLILCDLSNDLDSMEFVADKNGYRQFYVHYHIYRYIVHVHHPKDMHHFDRLTVEMKIQEIYVHALSMNNDKM